MDKSYVIVLILAILGLRLAHGDSTIKLCNQTPYPKLCNSIVVTKPMATLYETQFKLRESALQTTLDKAKEAHGLVKAMDVATFDERAKLAWADCMELYEDSVDQLNRSLGSTDHSSSQTWLSAAFTNQQTCRNGFTDFNLSSYLNSFPVMLSDFSKLLRNSLAINKAAAPSMAALSNKKTRNRRLLSVASQNGYLPLIESFYSHPVEHRRQILWWPKTVLATTRPFPRPWRHQRVEVRGSLFT